MSKKIREIEEIKKKLEEIDTKLDQLLRLQVRRPYSQEHLVPNTLASLPEHLRKTALAIAMIGQATAKQVASKTGRSRAAESDYLNQLASRGFLKEQRKGKEVYFRVFALYTLCPKCGTRVLMTLTQCPMCRAPLTKQ